MMRDFNLVSMCFMVLVLRFGFGEAKVLSKEKVYIVYMGGAKDGTQRNRHIQLMADLNNRKNDSIVQTYKSFFGFAARLSKEEAKSIEQTPGVVSVYPDRALPLHTTHSWDFLMRQNTNPQINNSVNYSSCESLCPCRGHDTIIGVLDTGIWPTHLSFNDKCMGTVPSRWKGICMPDENGTSFPCTKKVIGARYYDDPNNRGYIATALDPNGHGTHSASIAAGIPVRGAAYVGGLAKGTARGGSPCSRIAVYSVCGDDGHCWSASILKGFDDAITDGVDVISMSFGKPFDGFDNDVVYIGAFHAEEKGIIVVSSAGNDGPSSGIICNVAPWMITVGATTTDRDFEATVVLGNHMKIKAGAIIITHLNESVYPLVDGYSVRANPNDVANSTICFPGSLDDAKVKGKIVLCKDDDGGGLFPSLDKVVSLTEQKATGIILINNVINQDPLYFEYTFFVSVTTEGGDQIGSYIKTNRHPVATILPTKVTLNNYPAPVVASFSSRGPINGTANLLKPDVAAPGVGIVGAIPPLDGDTGDNIFEIYSGTSEACPHVSGLAATVKSWNPTWTPSMIRSAIMTTANPTNNLNTPITTLTGSRATPYDVGAGEITLFGPLDPGLVYETETIDYLMFLCNLGYNTSVIETIASTLPPNFDCPCNSSPDLISNMNYPSIAVFGLKKNGRTVKRTVTNVGEQYSTYTATVQAPVGLQVQVVPNILRFKKNVNKLSFNVTFKLATNSEENVVGSITWSNRKHRVRSPFVVSNNIA